MPLSDEMHEKGMDLLFDYLMVGGMPEVLDVFLKTGSHQEARNVLRKLYNNYLADMTLYQASSESVVRSTNI